MVRVKQQSLRPYYGAQLNLEVLETTDNRENWTFGNTFVSSLTLNWKLEVSDAQWQVCHNFGNYLRIDAFVLTSGRQVGDNMVGRLSKCREVREGSVNGMTV